MRWLRFYGLAVVCVAAAVTVKLGIRWLTGAYAAPYLLLNGSILLASWYGGAGAGVLALFLAAMAAYGFDITDNHISFGDPGASLRLWLFCIEGGLMCYVCPAMNRARKTAADRRRQVQQAEHDRELSERLLQQLIDTGGIGVCAGTLDGRLTEANDVFLRILSFPDDRLQSGKLRWTDLLPPEQSERGEQVLAEVRAKGRCQPIETELLDAEGRRTPVVLGMARIEDRPESFVAFLFDRSELKRSEKDLLAAHREAAVARQIKVDFLANVSHELRTPMNAIVGLTELALHEEIPPRLREYLRTALDAAQDLSLMINDILDFSKMEAGNFLLDPTPFSLRESLQRLVRTLEPRAAEKGLELMVVVPDDVPDGLVGDSLRLRQILTNLVVNAIKFTDQGEVVVRIGIEGRSEHGIRLVFSVRDTGIGIPEEARERILEPFMQVDTSTTRRHTGAGLGLSITRVLARLMDGRLWFESEVGRGSTFYVSLEFELDTSQLANKQDPDPDTLAKLHGVRLLIVDDNETNRRILQEVATSWNMRFVAVDSAWRAIEELEAAEKTCDPFGLILVDALMPERDGFSLVEEIRGRFQERSPVLLMLSSVDRRLFAERCKESGIEHFLEKPIARSELLQAIHTALGGASRASPPQPKVASPGPPARKLRILLAEDTRANQLVVIRWLERHGHQVVVALNGQEAIDRWQKDSFDVVLMDIQMPVVDGLQAAATIREIELRDHRPRTAIIALTAHARKGDERKCLDVGMDAYLSKPVEVHRMVELVEQLGYGRVATVSTAKKVESKGSDIINQAKALELLGGDRELLISLAECFLEDAPELLRQLQAAADSRDFAGVRRAAHSLKGLAASFDATAVTTVAEEIEGEAANQACPDGTLQTLLARSKDLSDRLRQLIETGS